MMDSSLPNLWIQRTRDAAVKNAESSKLPRADVDIVVGHQRVDSGYMSNHSTRSNSGPFSWCTSTILAMSYITLLTIT